MLSDPPSKRNWGAGYAPNCGLIVTLDRFAVFINFSTNELDFVSAFREKHPYDCAEFITTKVCEL